MLHSHVQQLVMWSVAKQVNPTLGQYENTLERMYFAMEPKLKCFGSNKNLFEGFKVWKKY